MRQGSGKVDPVNLIIIVENDGQETTFDVPTHGWENDHKLEWIRAEILLSGVTITKETKITIRQTQWPAATANQSLVRQYQNIRTDQTDKQTMENEISR